MQQIHNDLYDMRATGKVDLSILKSFDKLREFIKGLKQKWLEHRTTDSFYFYQGLRNAELLLDKMQYGFEHSQEKIINPKITASSIVLLKIIDDLLETTESDKSDSSTVNKILGITRDLRDVASKHNLIESVETDEELLDKENIRYNISSMMKNLGMLNIRVSN